MCLFYVILSNYSDGLLDMLAITGQRMKKGSESKPVSWVFGFQTMRILDIALFSSKPWVSIETIRIVRIPTTGGFLADCFRKYWAQIGVI